MNWNSLSAKMLTIILILLPALVYAEEGVMKWKIGGSGFVASPAIGDNGIVYTQIYPNLCAISPNGEIIWEYDLSDTINSPAIGEDGSIYVATWNGKLYAISSQGTLNWVLETGANFWWSSPSIGPDGTIYVGSSDGYLLAISQDGLVKWIFHTGDTFVTSAAIDQNGNVYIANNHIYSLDPNGNLRWSAETYGTSSPAIGENCMIYVGSGPNLAAITMSGEIKWFFPTDGNVGSSPAISADGTIIVGSDDTYLYAINPDGTLKWKFKTEGNVYSSPAIGADGTIFVGSGDIHTPGNNLYAINPDGLPKWPFHTGGNVKPSPAISNDGTLYVGSWDGYFYAIETNSLGLANSPWPMFHRNAKHTGLGRACNYSPISADAGPNLSLHSEALLGTRICGVASSIGSAPLLFRWLDRDTELSVWSAPGVGGEACFDVQTAFQLGEHTLTLEVTDGNSVAKDSMSLTVSNSAPYPAPVGGGTYELFAPVILSGQVADFDGDNVIYKWVNGELLITSGQIQTTYGGDPADIPETTTNFGSVGLKVIALRVEDGVNPPVSKNILVHIIDSTAPTIAPIPNKTILWPPNHKMVDILIQTNANDNGGNLVSLVASVYSNEPVDGLGDGDIAPDWTTPIINEETGTISLKLRAERSGSGSGRTYTISITARDQSGNSSTADVKIFVPHDNRNK